MKNKLIFLTLLSLVVVSVSAATSSEKRGWIGLGYVHHPVDTAPAWLYVQKVTPDGPADRAGFRPQDIVTAIDGRPVPNEKEVLALFVHLTTGRVMTFSVLRRYRTMTIRVKAIPLPSDRIPMWQSNAALLDRMTKQQR